MLFFSQIFCGLKAWLLNEVVGSENLYSFAVWRKFGHGYGIVAAVTLKIIVQKHPVKNDSSTGISTILSFVSNISIFGIFFERIQQRQRQSHISSYFVFAEIEIIFLASSNTHSGLGLVIWLLLIVFRMLKKIARIDNVLLQSVDDERPLHVYRSLGKFNFSRS